MFASVAFWIKHGAEGDRGGGEVKEEVGGDGGADEGGAKRVGGGEKEEGEEEEGRSPEGEGGTGGEGTEGVGGGLASKRRTGR